MQLHLHLHGMRQVGGKAGLKPRQSNLAELFKGSRLLHPCKGWHMPWVELKTLLLNEGPGTEFVAAGTILF